MRPFLGEEGNPAEYVEKFMKARLLIVGFILALATPQALADEGMWFYK
jgi:hypothetical protein